jgi:hypothetical protein
MLFAGIFIFLTIAIPLEMRTNFKNSDCVWYGMLLEILLHKFRTCPVIGMQLELFAFVLTVIHIWRFFPLNNLMYFSNGNFYKELNKFIGDCLIILNHHSQTNFAPTSR